MTVDGYLAELPDDARRTLQGVRDVIKATAPNAEELISYEIPLYKLDGKHLIGFGAWKDHLALYVMSSRVREKYRRELARFDQAGTKSTVRFTSAKPIPSSLVEKIVKTRIAEVRG